MSETEPKRKPKVLVTSKDLISKPLNLADRADAGPTYGFGKLGNVAPLLSVEPTCTYAGVACPECGESRDLHQRAYEIYARKNEDGPATRIAINNADCTSRSELSVSQEETAEAPSRRDTIAIQFHCYECNSLPVLHIRQHKGSTLMWFTITEKISDSNE